MINLDKALAKSKLTEKDAEEIGHKIKHEIRKRFSNQKAAPHQTNIS